MAGGLGLIPAELARRCQEAYREFRRVQHAIKLSGAEYARVPPQALESVRDTVGTFWAQVMDTAV